MTEPSLQRVKEVFFRVADAPAHDRQRVLDQSCGDDESLRSKVARMIAAEQSGFMASPLTPPVEVISFPEPAAPKQIGSYIVIEPLGEGGFGSVYRARQTEPIEREVAVKVIKPGMDTRQVIARFQSERQALAMLDHPNIASVFDAGTTDEGRPYFAMELIRGRPITEHCDAQRLPVDERLRLFIDVCRAVQHAHRKGLIHRDLKPTNVLVETPGTGPTAHPIVKVIDFGIAKAIDNPGRGPTLVTEAGQLMGTPDYMSPEQADPARGSVDTRSDIYALGALLFELLTGTTPLGIAREGHTGLTAIVRRISEDHPERPSSRVRNAARAGDIAEARAAEPSRLSARLRGDLDWIVMRAIEKDPDRRYETADGLARDIGRHLADEPVLAGPPSAVYRTKKFVRRHRVGVGIAAGALLLVGAALALISVALSRTLVAERDARIARGDTEAFNEFLLDDLIGGASPERDGHSVTVVAAIEKSLGSLDRRFADHPTAAARIRTTIGGVYHGLGLLEEARAVLERSSADYELLLGENDPETLLALTDLGSVLHHMGRIDDAEATLRDVSSRIKGSLDPDDPQRLRAEAILGEVLQAAGKHDEAEPLLRSSIDRMRRVLEDDDLKLLTALGSLGALLQSQGRMGEAEPIYLDTLRITLDRYPPGHPACLAALNNTAVLLMGLGKPADARPILEQLVGSAEAALPEGHWQTAWARYSFAACLIDLNEPETALPHLRLAYRDSNAALGPDHFLTERALGDLVSTLDTLGSPDTLELNRVSVRTRLRIANPDQRGSVVRALTEYLDRHERMSNESTQEEPLGFLDSAATEMMRASDPDAVTFAANLGRAYHGIGRFERAERWLLECYTKTKDASRGDQASLAAIAGDLARLYEEWGRSDRATAWFSLADGHRSGDDPEPAP